MSLRSSRRNELRNRQSVNGCAKEGRVDGCRRRDACAARGGAQPRRPQVDSAGRHRARGAQVRLRFLELFAVTAALAVFTAARFYMMSWIGERVTADPRRAVYAHVLCQSPQFFETLKKGEVLSRLTADATVIQGAVGSSLSMGLRSLVMALGAIGMLVATNPRLMLAVVGVITLIVLPALGIGRRVRRLSRASQDRIADEVLNAVPVVQSYTQENAETLRFARSNEIAVATAVRRAGTRAVLTAFLITGVFASLLYGLYGGVTGVIEGRLSAGELSQTALYIMIVASSVAVLAEVWGELLRTAGATERLMELLAARSPIADPPHPRDLPAGRGTQPLRVASSSRGGMRNSSRSARSTRVSRRCSLPPEREAPR